MMVDHYAAKKKEAQARGDAHQRLEKLMATDTSKMNRREMQEHQTRIAQAVADKALGA
ncbi:hypothetical protein T8J41_15915 [Nitratireductor rhodophyticola]|uniref:hypothetical protein n=1 Tax=Nitratireductor rhodophyticola TaxID=2854036 RepID=UPI002AC92A22|nr:hypothetical protein [Nitratireductor rhodophyticola]WPZ13619.1 hypothetical protein T8J41_15915 [Nitratireductor rhodophyticola]